MGGIEQSRMLDRFVSDLAERLPLALGTFVDRAGDAWLGRRWRPADDAVHGAGPVVEHLDRLAGVAGELDAAHVVVLGQRCGLLRHVASHAEPGRFGAVEDRTDALAREDDLRVVQLLGRAPRRGWSLDRAVGTEQPAGSTSATLPRRPGR